MKTIATSRVPRHKTARTLPQLNKEQAERFWSYVLQRGPDECWSWTGTGGRSGYGLFWIPSVKGKNWSAPAHKVAYTLTYESIPEGMFVCHRCDIPACCNPNHLFLGTPRDNVHDMILKGRSSIAKVCHPEGWKPTLAQQIPERRRGRPRKKPLEERVPRPRGRPKGVPDSGPRKLTKKWEPKPEVFKRNPGRPRSVGVVEEALWEQLDVEEFERELRLDLLESGDFE